MRLPLTESLRLRRIGKAIARTDPGLAARFALFARLTADEDMPPRERLHTHADHPGTTVMQPHPRERH